MEALYEETMRSSGLTTLKSLNMSQNPKWWDLINHECEDKLKEIIDQQANLITLKL